MVVVVVVLVAVLMLRLPLLHKQKKQELNCARNDASQRGTNHV